MTFFPGISGSIAVQGGLTLLNPGGTAVSSAAAGTSSVLTVPNLPASYTTIIAVVVLASGTAPAYAVAVDGTNGPRFAGAFHSSTLVGVTGLAAFMGFANNVGDTLNLTVISRAAYTGTLYVYAAVGGAPLAAMRGDGRTKVAGALAANVNGTSGTALVALSWGRYLIKLVVAANTTAGDTSTLTATIGGTAVPIAVGTATSPANVVYDDGLLCDTNTAITIAAAGTGEFTIVYDIVP